VLCRINNQVLCRTYPALVETEHAVDLRLLKSPAAATAATRDGLRRLFVFALQTSFAKLETQLPGSLAKGRSTVRRPRFWLKSVAT
jgi:hypothetical protein